MIDEVSKKLQQLDAFLCSDAVGDDAMLLSELDGFLAGVIVCPDLIMPSEWMPVIWGDDEGPLYDTMEQAQTVTDLIMGHYNDLIGHLDRGDYRPIYDFDTDNDALWEIWAEGFEAAVLLRPDAWLSFGETDDDDLQRAWFVLMRLIDLAKIPPGELEPIEIDEELEKLAPDLIPSSVEDLHRARLAMARPGTRAANQNRPKVGRNDPCFCGSGKKFKKCCLN